MSRRSIIAMKGHPFTLKTKFAALIAAYLKCPVLSLDDFLDYISPDCLQTSPSTNISTPQDLAFDIICRIVKSHLSIGLLENIVIDSPLSSRSHLDLLIELASSIERTRLVIVECKPQNEYAWQTKFEEYIQSIPDQTRKWYKAKNWSDIEKAIKEDYNETSDGYKVSKLVLDPFSNYQKCPPVTSMMHYDNLFTPPPFVKAVKYMITREEDEGTDHIVVYDIWRQSQQLHSRALHRKKEENHGSGHSITNYAEEGLGFEVNCTACGKQIMGGAAYTCDSCSLALDKECAESFDNNNTWGDPIPDFYYQNSYRFPEQSSCASCKKFSHNCSRCLFETHLKCRLMPTIIRHECEKHFLSIVLPPLRAYMEVYECGACGETGHHGLYSCKMCGVAYHYKCLELPRRVEHVHGGHHHHMLLKFTSEEAEDYMCQVCVDRGDSDRRDPKLWFYSCEECVYEVHLCCIHAR